MFEIYFYIDSQGNRPVLDYLRDLAKRSDKDSRIKLTKIREYIQALKLRGTRAGEPYVKHLEGDIWELRPLRDRILFVGFDGTSFVLLHVFVKKTQKTPRREIDKAKREFNRLISQGKIEGEDDE